MVPSEELQRAGLGGGRGKINLKTPWVLILYHCVRLFVTPMDCSSPGSSIHGILHARLLGWVAIRLSRGSSQHGDQTASLVLQADSLLSEPPGKPWC